MSEPALMWTFLVLYVLAMVGLGAWSSRWIDDDEDFMVAGRGVSWPLQGMGMTAIIVSGTTGATVGAIGYTQGLVGHWWITGWIIAVVLGAVTVAPFARRTGGITPTEWLETVFDGRVRVVAGLAMSIGLLFSPLANILGGSLVISGLMGISPDTAIIILGVSGVIYLTLGGMWATVFSDVIQFALFTIAFIGGTLWLVFARGGLDRIAGELPSESFNPLPHGEFQAIDWSAGSAFGLFFLMFCLTFTVYWGRGAAARSAGQATRGWLLGVLLAVPFAVVMPLAGMFVRAQGVELADPQLAFGVFMGELPAVAAAAMMAGILAATMSTVEIGAMAGISILFRDVFERLSRRRFSAAESVRWIRIFTAFYGLVAVFGGIVLNRVAPGVGALVGLAFLSAFAATLLPALFASMWARTYCNATAALLSIGAGTVYAFYSLISGSFEEVHPMLPCALISAVVYVAVTAVSRVTGKRRRRTGRDADRGAAEHVLTDAPTSRR